MVMPQRHDFDAFVQTLRIIRNADEAVRVTVVAGNHPPHGVDLLGTEGTAVVALWFPLEDDNGNHFSAGANCAAIRLFDWPA